MKKLLYIAPHLSTGGLPQYLTKKIELLKNEFEIYLVEWVDCTGGVLVVTRNKILKLIDQDKFFTLGEDKQELINIINQVQPDIIHLEEIPEMFIEDDEITYQVYNSDRKYTIIETSHDSSYDTTQKRFFPDKFMFVSQWQIDQYIDINIPKLLVEYPIEYIDRPNRTEALNLLGLDPNKRHVLHVGLYTPRKNQAEFFEYARQFPDVQFHSLGNQADNFKWYWEPLMQNKPDNIIWWNERTDVDAFYQAMDLFLFTSRGSANDKETMPLVIREAISYQIPILIYNLEVYQNYFDKFKKVNYLQFDDFEHNINLIRSTLDLVELNKDYFNVTYDENLNKVNIIINKSHPELTKFNYRVKDALTNLVFNPIGFNIDFAVGHNFWFVPNISKQYHNGVCVEFFDNNNNLIQTNTFLLKQDKINWNPDSWPTTEVYYQGKKIELTNHENDTSSGWSFYEVFFSEDYKNIETNDIVVDVGANLGYFSIYAAKQGASKIYALEPLPDTYYYLSQNVKDLPITALNYGIDSTTQEVEFLTGEVSSMSRNTYFDDTQDTYGYNKTNKVKAQLKSFNEFIKENNINFIDYLKIDCEGGEKGLFESIDPDFLKYKVKKIAGEIHVNILGEKEYLKIKNQIISSGFEYTDNYNSGDALAVFYAQRKPKLRLVHCMNTPEKEREQLSIRSLKQVEKYGVEYIQHITPLATEFPSDIPCSRPHLLSKEPGEYLLTPSHYGCYDSHKTAFLNYNEGCDGLIICECDALLTESTKETVEKFEATYFRNIKYNLVYTSFGKQIPNDPHIHLEDDFYSTELTTEAHCYLTSQPFFDYVVNKFNTTPWEAFDLWQSNYVRDHWKGVYRKAYSLQANGYSSIDQHYKVGHTVHDISTWYEPSLPDNDISVLIHTCDHYNHFWNGMIKSFRRYWNWNLGWPVYFANEECDLPFDDSRFIQLKTGKTEGKEGFSTRLRTALEKIPTKYVLYLQDDMWPFLPVDYNIFKKSLYTMRYNDWNGLLMHEKIWGSYKVLKTNKFVNNLRVLKLKPNSEWLYNENAAIWNKDFLLKHIHNNEDPWNVERTATKRIYNNEIDHKVYMLNHRWYYQPGASQNGKKNELSSTYEYYLELTENLNKEFDLGIL
jgi:FkbM family methyltransferase